jgi:hypothetical protein
VVLHAVPHLKNLKRIITGEHLHFLNTKLMDKQFHVFKEDNLRPQTENLEIK